MKVSVVIPAFNEEVLLAACIDSLLQQDYEGDIEVIVVDNASTDSSPELVEARFPEVNVISGSGLSTDAAHADLPSKTHVLSPKVP